MTILAQPNDCHSCNDARSIVQKKSSEKRRDRSNHIAHSENNLASLQRASSLIEVAFVSKKQKYIGTCERSSFPLLFVNGLADVQDCLNMYVNALRRLKKLLGGRFMQVEVPLNRFSMVF